MTEYHEPITVTRYCYCAICFEKVGNYLKKYADNRLEELKKKKDKRE